MHSDWFFKHSGNMTDHTVLLGGHVSVEVGFNLQRKQIKTNKLITLEPMFCYQAKLSIQISRTALQKNELCSQLLFFFFCVPCDFCFHLPWSPWPEGGVIETAECALALRAQPSRAELECRARGGLIRPHERIEL